VSATTPFAQLRHEYDELPQLDRPMHWATSLQAEIHPGRTVDGQIEVGYSVPNDGSMCAYTINE
jgi:hypothetical protein